MGARIPVPDLSPPKTGDPDKVHVVETDDPKTWEDDYWRMMCGLEVRAFDDGTLIPMTDFYTRDQAHRASCEACRKACGL